MELPLVFVAGILGTAHCLGMCGPMVLSIGGAATGWGNASSRQLLYTVGRIFTYAVLGMIAGYCGERLARYSTTLINVPAILAVVAGVVFLYQGLHASGLLQRWRRSARTSACKSNRGCGSEVLLAPFFRGRGYAGALLAGVFTGFLPCGLLYGMLTLAASTHDLLLGGATMFAFGLGTAPLLILTGVVGRFLSLASRKSLYAAAAWCLMLTGMISLVRGASHLSWGDRPARGCPLCAGKTASAK